MKAIALSLLAAALALAAAPSLHAQEAVPGDAYWPGSQSGQPLPTTSETVPGDEYWSSGASAGPSRAPIPKNMSGVMADEVFRAVNNPINSIPWARAHAIQEAAAAYGAQAGMASRGNDLNRAVAGRSRDYDRAFNFAVVMLEPGFLPPVISEGRHAYNQPNANEVRAADRIYKIEFPARLVNTPPRWQEYLSVPVSSPLMPDKTALPRTAEEKQLWNEWAAKGWAQGVSQADRSFQEALARLNRDYQGMLRYKMLYQQGVVTKPIMAKSHLGTTGGGDEMAINDRIYRITNPAALDPDQRRWSQPMPQTHHVDTPSTRDDE